MIKTEALTLHYLYGATGIKDISIDCPKGECVAVLAPDEGGKTSLLKCIAGLYPASSGKIYIDGRDVTHQKIKERDILLVHSDGGIIKGKSVKGNLELPLKIRKLPKQERAAIVAKAAQEFDIYPLLGDFGYRLYDDDKLRLALCRTAIRHSPVVMLDDIFALAPIGQRQTMFLQLMPKIRSLKDSAVIFATTSLQEALTAGDKILVLHYGIAEQFGTPKQLKEYPASVIVDRLVNPHKNRLAATVTYKDGSAYINILNKQYPVQCPSSFAASDVICSFAAHAAQDGRLPIADYFYYGDTLYIKCGGITAKASGYPSAKYDITIDADSIQLFDPTSEKLLTPQP